MPRPILQLLSVADLQRLHRAALQIIDETGVVVGHPQVRQRLAERGARVEQSTERVRIAEAQVDTALDQACHAYTLYGREHGRAVRFGAGGGCLISSPGQAAWFDHHSGQRRPGRLEDVRTAARLGDVLENVAVVGSLAVPEDVPLAIRDVAQTIELLRGSGKPVRAFPVSARSSRYVLELFSAVAGGREALRTNPMAEMMLNPISPLLFPEGELEILMEFLDWGQPVCIAPMPLASGSGPATLAGTLALAHAEFLAGLTIVQALAPGTAVMHGCIPHILDPRTALCSFGAPEQGLMALAMAEMGKSLGFPLYVNVNLTDSKSLDAQAGFEKMASLLAGMLAGVDLFGHAGIVGADQGASLAWLVADDQAVSFARRIARGFEIDDERLAVATIASVGPGGNFLAESHTIDHFRREFWLTDVSFDFAVDDLLARHTPTPLDPALESEFERILAAARKELV